MPIDTYRRIERLVTSIASAGIDTSKVNIYSEGLKSKLRQSEFALSNLKRLYSVPEQANTQESLNIEQQFIFFCDCFWDFLRSSLDIFAQLINEVKVLNIPEKEVDIKKVAFKFNSIMSGSSLDRELQLLMNSNTLRKLEDYRHCSTHRRPIYIETHTSVTSVSGTSGYTSGTSDMTTVNRYLCVNPWDLNPNMDNNSRVVHEYCETMLRRIKEKIDIIINKLALISVSS